MLPNIISTCGPACHSFKLQILQIFVYVSIFYKKKIIDTCVVSATLIRGGLLICQGLLKSKGRSPTQLSTGGKSSE